MPRPQDAARTDGLPRHRAGLLLWLAGSTPLFASRLAGWTSRFDLALCGAVLLGGCVQATQIYPLTLSQEHGASVRGSVQIERIEGDQRLLAFQLEGLAGPESWGADYTAFVAWVEDSRGHTVKVGPLSYDRARRSARLLGTVDPMRSPVSNSEGRHPGGDDGVDFQAFTVRVTAERAIGVTRPSQMLVGERHLLNQ